jgi:hypothetical protein
VRFFRRGLVVPMAGLAIALVGGLAVVRTAHALIINEAKFVELGGDLGAVKATFSTVAARLHSWSLSEQFMPVGWIEGCTATWLGEEGGRTYLLTAAHCVSATHGEVTRTHRTFKDWRGQVIAQGEGWAVRPPKWANWQATPSWDGFADDVAVLSLPRVASPVDGSGRRLAPPTIADTPLQTSELLHYVGYGLVGVGQTYGYSHLPATEKGRLRGEAPVAGFFSGDRGFYSRYESVKASQSWARPSPGDSGSAAWRLHQGYWQAAGVNAGMRPSYGVGPHLARHAAWIEGVFPGAVMQSERMSVTASAPFVSRNHALDPSGTNVFFVIPSQTDAIGPTAGRSSRTKGDSMISVAVKESRTGAISTIRLRAHRDAGCRRSPIEDAAPCPGSQNNQLKVAFRADDNPGLKPGAYTGRFHVDVLSWLDRSRQERVTLHVDVRHLLRGQVSTTSSYVSPNLAERAAHGTIYYTVPPQARAQGPVAGVWNGSPLSSRIDVTVRDAVTQQDRQVVLRAQRDPLCGGRMTRMEDAATCQRRSAGRVMVRFHREDNPQLPAGLHRGRVTLQARGWTDPAFDQLIEIDVDLDTL